MAAPRAHAKLLASPPAAEFVAEMPTSPLASKPQPSTLHPRPLVRPLGVEAALNALKAAVVAAASTAPSADLSAMDGRLTEDECALHALASEVEAVRSAVADAAEKVDDMGRAHLALLGRITDVHADYSTVAATLAVIRVALGAATPAVRVRAAVALSTGSGKEPLYEAIVPYYAPGTETAANLLLCSPPSLGKSFAIRRLGELYDVYLEHGCSDDVDEVATLLGNPMPNQHGGFVNVDGMIAEAVRLAATGKNVLFLWDEVFRLSPRAQEWALTFLTGVKTPDGKMYRLRTRRVDEHNSLETITCPAKHLHIIGATNLSDVPVVEAFWSRWFKLRVEFTLDIVREVARNVCNSWGITDSAKLCDGFASVVMESRHAKAEGSLRFPADVRLLEVACASAASPTGPSVGAFIGDHLADATANWNIDTGDVLAESVTKCEAWTSLLKSL